MVTLVDGYDGVHGGYGLGERNADGERILEFCDAMELIVTNTPRAGSGVVRMDPLRFLAGCRTRRLNQV